MNIIGIGALTHDSGAALIKDGKIKIAVNEERFNRIKLSGGFPEFSLDYILKNIKKDDVNKIVFSDLGEKEFSKRSKNLLLNPYLFSSNIPMSLRTWAIMARWKLKTHSLFKKQQNLLKEKYGEKFIKVEHHATHAATAHITSGINKNLIITTDNHGDFLTTTTYVGENNKLEKVNEVKWPHSPGFFYAIVTKALGFRQWRHEGKITGLAAYGNPNSPVYDKIKKLMWYENGTIKTRSLIGSDNYVKNLAKKYSREDMAAVFQRIFEEVIGSYIKNYMDQTGMKNIALAGGAFANVKLNQRVKELGAENIFIHPHMGDGGTGVGAAIHESLTENIKPYQMSNVYFGPDYSDKEIKEELEKTNTKYECHKDIEYQTAELLAKGKVVARFNGAMEYGPRALGNRSILYQATDPTVNDWLNEKLKRTEFMPFAPVTLEKYGPKSYKNLKGAEYTAKFMTICFNATDYLKETCPAIVHVDGTARPQLINEKDNLSYFKIVDEYRKITQLPTIINTSFNMHEEPIVCTPADAIRSFKQGHLDYLAMGNYLIKN